MQARWGHVNEDYSLLTKIQAVLLDAHFVLEHGSRNRGGCFFNFNGTAGIWRRDAIYDGGGWQHDTLTEDLDLSYRTQLKGWQFVFVQDHVSPAELPVEMNAFKSQQHRWAKGSIQTFLKLMPRILQSDQPFHVKAEAFFHLSANFNYPLMCVLSILMAPSMVIRYNMGWYEMMLIDIPLFFAATASVANFYMVCQRELYPQTWTERLKYLPLLMSIGIGLAVNNTKAVFEALFHKPSEFVRTPKYAVEGLADEWSQKKYRQSVSVQPMIEVALGLYFTATLVLRARQRHLRHRAVPDAVPGRVPLHRHAVAVAAVRSRDRRSRSGQRSLSSCPASGGAFPVESSATGGSYERPPHRRSSTSRSCARVIFLPAPRNHRTIRVRGCPLSGDRWWRRSSASSRRASRSRRAPACRSSSAAVTPSTRPLPPTPRSG